MLEKIYILYALLWTGVYIKVHTHVVHSPYVHFGMIFFLFRPLFLFSIPDLKINAR